MNTILMILGILLTVVLGIGLRSMRADHLYAISTRFELGVWFIFTLSFAGQFSDSLHEVMLIPPMIQLVLLGLMLSRLLTNASFILGNPPRVRIVATKQRKIKLHPVHDVPTHAGKGLAQEKQTVRMEGG